MSGLASCRVPREGRGSEDAAGPKVGLSPQSSVPERGLFREILSNTHRKSDSLGKNMRIQLMLSRTQTLTQPACTLPSITDRQTDRQPACTLPSITDRQTDTDNLPAPSHRSQTDRQTDRRTTSLHPPINQRQTDRHTHTDRPQPHIHTHKISKICFTFPHTS